MRRLLAVACCAAYVAFGCLAGAVHVHESADHHEEMRGLHLDHAHLSVSARGERERHHGIEADHVGHHDGDALYLTATTLRSFDPSLRVMPAIVSVGETTDPPADGSEAGDWKSCPLRGPPENGSIRLRAPPA